MIDGKKAKGYRTPKRKNGPRRGVRVVKNEMIDEPRRELRLIDRTTAALINFAVLTNKAE